MSSSIELRPQGILSELETDNHSGVTLQDDSGEHQEFSLPPADRGKDAWLFLAAGFVVEAFVWGKEMPNDLIQYRNGY